RQGARRGAGRGRSGRGARATSSFMSTGDLGPRGGVPPEDGRGSTASCPATLALCWATAARCRRSGYVGGQIACPVPHPQSIYPWVVYCRSIDEQSGGDGDDHSGVRSQGDDL